MNQSKLDQLRAEVALLKLRLRTARDKEILLLIQILELKKQLQERETV